MTGVQTCALPIYSDLTIILFGLFFGICLIAEKMERKWLLSQSRSEERRVGKERERKGLRENLINEKLKFLFKLHLSNGFLYIVYKSLLKLNSLLSKLCGSNPEISGIYLCMAILTRNGAYRLSLLLWTRTRTTFTLSFNTAYIQYKNTAKLLIFETSTFSLVPTDVNLIN